MMKDSPVARAVATFKDMAMGSNQQSCLSSANVVGLVSVALVDSAKCANQEFGRLLYPLCCSLASPSSHPLEVTNPDSTVVNVSR